MMLFVPGLRSQAKVWEYVKRSGNRFYFVSGKFNFDVELSGKELFDFVDQFDVGDKLSFV